MTRYKSKDIFFVQTCETSKGDKSGISKNIWICQMTCCHDKLLKNWIEIMLSNVQSFFFFYSTLVCMVMRMKHELIEKKNCHRLFSRESI